MSEKKRKALTGSQKALNSVGDVKGHEMVKEIGVHPQIWLVEETLLKNASQLLKYK